MWFVSRKRKNGIELKKKKQEYSFLFFFNSFFFYKREEDPTSSREDCVCTIAKGTSGECRAQTTVGRVYLWLFITIESDIASGHLRQSLSNIFIKQ